MTCRRVSTYFVYFILFIFATLLAACGETPTVTPDDGVSDPKLGPVTFSSSLVQGELCVSAPQGAVAGEPLVQLECEEKDTQRFEFHVVEGKTATYVLKNVASGLCVAVSDRPGDSSSSVQQFACDAKTSHRFTLKPLGPSAERTFRLGLGGTDTCLESLAGAAATPAELVVRACDTRPAQTWQVPNYKGQTPPTDPPPTDPPPTDPPPETLPLPDTLPSADDAVVGPIDWAKFSAGRPADEGAARLAQTVLNANKYVLSTWWNEVKNFDAQVGTYLDFGGTDEHEIRHPGAVAVGLAVSLSTGLYDPAVVGVPSETAKARALKLVRSLVYRHEANSSGGWGSSWQSALWAYKAGFASWLLWDDLSETERGYVKTMLEAEAARFIGYDVPHYRDATGTIVSPGDTKAEENGWNASLLQLAFDMMPEHPHAYAWMQKNIELKASVYASEQDVSSDALLHGRPLKDWLTGSNAYDDGVVINHTRVHPDYMAAAIKHNLEAAISASLAGKATPRVALRRADTGYRALVDLVFEEGTTYPDTEIRIRAPGGTIYVAGSVDLYYPQGNDWGTDRIIPHVLSDALATSFGFDTLASRKAAYWEALHAQKLLEQQSRHADGHTYASAKEDTYKGREEMVAEFSALAYLSHWLVHQEAFSTSDTVYPLVIDNNDSGFELIDGIWKNDRSRPATLGRTTRYAASGDGSSKVRYSPKLAKAGDYKVYAWWPCGADGASNAPYRVVHAEGSTTMRVDQSKTCGVWTPLGQYSFATGTGGYVEQTNDADGVVLADAVLFFQ